MASVNKVIILGNLGQDPELRSTPSGTPVCTLSVATTDVRTDANGMRQDKTEWHRVIVWNKQAENCAKFLSKGRSVYIEGRIQTRSWDDQNGQKRYSTEIVAQTVQFIGSSRDQQGGASVSNNSSYPNMAASGGVASQSNDFGVDPSNLDDIPF